jgi:protein-tyrosine phosphatase
MTDALIELHFHCLPGLDDGPLSWDEAVALCRAAASDGSTIIVATPHVLRYPWVNDDAATRDQRILKLNTLLGGQPKVLAGCEYLFSSDALELWDRGTAGPLTGLNRTDYLLTEFPWGIDVQNVSRFLYEFSLPGVTLVIAHPERQRDFIRDPDILALLVKRGAIAQLTAGSFLGDFGDLPRNASLEFVERGLVHLVASDAHSLSSRPPRLAAAREFFEGRWGREVAAGIFEQNPEAVLKGKPIPFRLPGGGSEVETRKVFTSRYCLTPSADQKAGREEARVEGNEQGRGSDSADLPVTWLADQKAGQEEARVEGNEQGRGPDSADLPGMVAAVAALLTENSPKVSSGALAGPPLFSPALLSRAATTKSTKSMTLSPEQRKFYQRALAVTRQEISEVEVQIHDEVARVKDRVRELQRAQKAAKLMYDAGCMRLGIPNSLKGSEPLS